MKVDSCTHPTCSGEWLNGRSGLTHGELVTQLRRHNYARALAIGLPGVGDYQHHRFYDLSVEYPELTPVAALTTIESSTSIRNDVRLIAQLGYDLIKVHPRLLGYERCIELLPVVLDHCIENELGVLLCTYPEYQSQISPFGARRRMVDAVRQVADARVVVMHSGVLDSRPFVELAAERKNVLLDFSFTLPRYEHSTVDAVSTIASRYPDLVCFGTDSPEWLYSYCADLLGRVESQLTPEAFAGFVGLNLIRWLHGD